MLQPHEKREMARLRQKEAMLDQLIATMES
jgi:hypothetical protein